MLRNRLSVLLAERELTAAKVYEDTGISRSTLSSLVNNTGDGVQYKTLDNLCNYLGVTPSEFFDYAPFLLKYYCYVSEYRKDAVAAAEENDEEIISDMKNEELDIFGKARYTIEIIAKKGQKQYKYLLGIDIFLIEYTDETNASKDFDIEVLLEDQYGGRSFVDEVYNKVSVTFQTQIKNECFKLIETPLEELRNYAAIKNKDLKVFIQTPFGDTKSIVKPIKITRKKLEEKYGTQLIEYWSK